jgi:hypothetical protein
MPNNNVGTKCNLKGMLMRLLSEEEVNTKHFKFHFPKIGVLWKCDGIERHVATSSIQHGVSTNI